MENKNNPPIQESQVSLDSLSFIKKESSPESFSFKIPNIFSDFEEFSIPHKKIPERFIIRHHKVNSRPLKTTPCPNQPHLSQKNLLRKKLLLLNDVAKKMLKLSDSEDLFQLMFSLSPFKSFICCQFIILEKGQPEATSETKLRDYQTSFKKLPASKFNHLYNFINKSKNKNFTQFDKFRSEVSAIGPFMATSNSFKHYRVILILSQNSFLEPTLEEFYFFNSICSSFCRSYKKITADITLKKKFNLSHLFFQSLPFSCDLSFENKILVKSLKGNGDRGGKSEVFKINKYLLSIDWNISETIFADIYHQERISLLGELFNTLKHELGNPLFGLGLSNDFIQEDLPEELLELSEDIKSQINQCQKIIKSFSSLYSNESNLHLTSIDDIIKKTLTLSKSETRGIQTIVRFDPNVKNRLISHPMWLGQIIFNWIVNSSQAIKNETQILKEHYINIDIDQNNSTLRISVSDSGPGLSVISKEKLFTPFFTTKKNGNGLGLTICQNLASKLKGVIKYENSFAGGACFTLSIPTVANL